MKKATVDRLGGMTDVELAEMFQEIRSEMYDRKMTEEYAELLAEHPKLVQQSEEILVGARNHFTFGIVNVDITYPEKHPSHIQIKSADSSHTLRLLLGSRVSSLELAEAVKEAHDEEIAKL